MRIIATAYDFLTVSCCYDLPTCRRLTFMVKLVVVCKDKGLSQLWANHPLVTTSEETHFQVAFKGAVASKRIKMSYFFIG